MRIETSLKVLPEHPTSSAWAALRILADQWNHSHSHGFRVLSGVMLQLRIPDTTSSSLSELLAMLDRMRAEVGIRLYASSRRIYEEEDYRKAAFVGISGVALDQPNRPFCVNAHQALGKPLPCPSCGWQDVFNAPQVGPFMIDESMLDEAPLSGDQPYQGWDCVALPAGRQLFSARLLAALTQECVRGLEVMQVLSTSTGRASERAYQLRAHKAILTPCVQNEADTSYCVDCGAVLVHPSDGESTSDWISPQPEFQLSSEQVGDSEIFSRHPDRTVMLYVARRAYRILNDGQYNGVIRVELIQAPEIASA